ncbi:MAG: cysteine synthase A [Candidatus Anaerobiospirillum merdipullorum]|uniref:Cysteine synthase n=1 Tax=Candidatus Anaerobiospirillum merdipullorum TaxID=2838450 RepID=A0A9E2NS90_9GAMM|nr:cysteine synthase A [Candidatus Anaerobiospirillum merdipullorum]
MRISSSMLDLIGHTPLVELHSFAQRFALKGRLIAKVESLNPGGSIKDRTALSMIKDGFLMNLINADTLIIEPTSGNTGIGLALACAHYKLKLILTLPDNMSVERRAILQAFGAQLVLTPAAEGMAGAIAKAREIAKQNENSFIPGQFDNEANPRIHAICTGPEIWDDTDGKVAAVVAGVGTGGTITGIGRFLKGRNKHIKMIAVEPATSAVLSGGKAGPHQLQGIGAGFVPRVYDASVVDEIIPVDNQAALDIGALACKSEGLFCGISAGAALKAGIEVASRDEFAGKIVVVIIPDSGDRYLSTPMFAQA